MCLSNVYKSAVSDENLLFSNVAKIECMDGYVVLTDVMERTMEIEGRLVSVDLVENKAIICPAD